MKYLTAMRQQGFTKVKFDRKENDTEYYDVNYGTDNWYKAKITGDTLYLLADDKWEDEGKIRVHLDPNAISEGDYVNFGHYGNLYVLKKDAGLVSEGLLWVTDNKDERYNREASGRFVSESSAISILEKGNCG